MECKRCPFYKYEYSRNKCELTGDEFFEEETNCKLVEKHNKNNEKRFCG